MTRVPDQQPQHCVSSIATSHVNVGCSGRGRVRYSNRVCSDDPFVAEILSAPYSVHEFTTSLTLKLVHHLFATFFFSRTTLSGIRNKNLTAIFEK